MKYSLRSLMIAVLVLPPMLAWGAMPLYRWLTTPKAPEPAVVIETMWVSDIMPPELERIPIVTLPNSQAPAQKRALPTK
jgi:hypothetical protein